MRRSDPSAAAGPSLAPILAVHFLGTLGFSLAIPFLVFVVTDLGGAPWTYGVVGATYSACQFVGAPLLGRWSDRAGRRPVLIVSQVGTLAAWLLFLLALSIPEEPLVELAGATLTVPLLLVVAARALDGLTGGNISVANAYVADLTEDRPALRQTAFGKMGMAASLGFVIGPAAAGLLGGTAWGARLPIAVAALAAAATTVAIVALLRESPRRCPDGAPRHNAVESLAQQEKRCDRETPRIPRAPVLREAPVRRALLGIFLLFLAFNVFYSGFPVHAEAVYGWSAGRLGLFFALLSGAMIVAQGPLLQALSGRVPPRALFAVGVGGLALALLAVAPPAGAATWIGALLFAVGNGLSWPTYQARLAELGGTSQGVVQGAAGSAGSAASIAGLIAGGMLYPWLGGGLFVVGAATFGAVLLLTPLWFGQPPRG